MKICTITCHDVYNHGASLQAYSLMNHLKREGHEVEIIDYKPDYLSNHYNLLSIDNPIWDKNFLIRLIYLTLKFPGRLKGLRRKKAFDAFRERRLLLTSLRYKSNSELKDSLPTADVFICGSDQIWNTLYPNGKDPAFYLDFVPDNKIKISYAASFATESIPEEYKPIIQKRVNRLNGIGVREKSAVRILDNLSVSNVTHVVDPVFLLSKEDWDKVGEDKFQEEYILVYDFDNSNVIKNIALEIAKKKGLKIYSLTKGKDRYCDRYFDYVGPETFVALIKNASFILSNSFHAAVFSIIYQKQFAIIKRNESINTRMEDLLKELLLNDRLVSEIYNIDDLLKKIDYKSSLPILENKIKLSKEYLTNHIIERKDKGIEKNSICN